MRVSDAVRESEKVRVGERAECVFDAEDWCVTECVDETVLLSV